MIHPQSYVHSIIRFKNGLIKMILYNADMKIPISNTIYQNKNSLSNKSTIEQEDALTIFTPSILRDAKSKLLSTSDVTIVNFFSKI